MRVQAGEDATQVRRLLFELARNSFSRESTVKNIASYKQSGDYKQ
jgi:hypothetical protein